MTLIFISSVPDDIFEVSRPVTLTGYQIALIKLSFVHNMIYLGN